MRDPVVEAAKRSFQKPWGSTADAMRSAAREALNPLRKQWKLLETAAAKEDAEVEFGMKLVLDAIAPYIFTAEELS